MKQLKRIAAALTGCALVLTLTTCSGGEEPVIERPADLSEKAIYADYLGIAAELPDAIYDKLGEQIFPTAADVTTAPEGVTVNGQIVLLYQSGAVYDRVMELQATGTAMEEAEYLELSRQAGDLCAITSVVTDTIGGQDIAAITGFSDNTLLGEMAGNSVYFSDGGLTIEDSLLSEEDAADLEALKAAVPDLQAAVQLYTPVDGPQGLTEGAVISGFDTVDLDGNAVDSSVLAQANLTVLQIWATTCTPCITEMPNWETLSQNYRDKGVQVLGLVADVYGDETKAEEARTIAAEAGVTYPNLLADAVLDEQVLYDVTGTPTTVFLDSEGTILRVIEGTRDLEDLSALVDELLAGLS